MSLNMSLFYVFSHPFDLPDEYKCPENLTISAVPRPLLGIYFLASGSVFITLYFLCFLAILKLNLKIPVYQLMLILSIFDIAALSLNTVTTGIFGILGISFCQYPLPIFIYGAVGQACWMSGSVCLILLAVERCVEINPKFPLEIIFRKRVFPLVFAALILFSFWCFLFVKPMLFSIKYSCWMFNPLVGKDRELYVNNPDTINNIILVVCSSTLYLYLSYNLIFKFGYSTSIWLYKTKRQIISQSLILCVFHAVTAGIYLFMRFIYYTPTLIILSQIIWGWSSGCMCIAYLTFNRTIRNSVIKIIVPKSIRMRYGLHVDFKEHLAKTEAAHTVGSGIVKAGGCVIKVNNFMTFD